MPELAEVEYYRSRWDAGRGENILRVHLHPEKRIFRGATIRLIEKIAGERFQSSESSGKQMLFRFSQDLWLGLHLGMTGKLAIGPPGYSPSKHDHLVLFQKRRALIFNDARQFGRVLIHQGAAMPDWWSRLAPSVTSKHFTLERMSQFLARRAKLAIKPALLLQQGFPGIGNWMADEILWRAGLAPSRLGSSLTAAEKRNLWRQVRFVAREALKKIGKDFGDPPCHWLFHERWKRAGHCPKHRTPLRKETIGGRTTAWCPRCQR